MGQCCRKRNNDLCNEKNDKLKNEINSIINNHSEIEKTVRTSNQAANEQNDHFNEGNETLKKETYSSIEKQPEIDQNIKSNNQPNERDNHTVTIIKDSLPFFSLPGSRIEGPLVQVIINALELGSLLKLDLPTQIEDFSAANLELSSLLVRVLNSMKGDNIQNPEDNANLINRFLKMEESECMDPLDFLLRLLKLLNNDEDIIVEELPHYYMEDTKEIPKKVLIEKERELKRITEENWIRKSLGLTTIVPFLQVCTNPNCSKQLFVNVNCELEFYYTYLIKPGVSISESLNNDISELKMNANCFKCRKTIENYRTRCRKIIVNYPEFLLIRVKEEQEEDLIDGADLKLTEITSLKLESRTYQLRSLITKINDKDYNCFKIVNGVFKDSNQHSVNGEGEFKKAFILLYSLSG